MKTEAIKRNLVLSLSIDFSIAIIDYCEKLNERKRFVISKQLQRSATSIGANIMEAQQAESSADFIHKLKIAAKEGAETQYWLILCLSASGHGNPERLIDQLDSINRMLNRILTTTKARL
jgi:four helix bundle protein